MNREHGEERRKHRGGPHLKNAISEQTGAHISVCVCTYKRPLPLKRLLLEIMQQQTGGLFTYSIVVADNDRAKSAEAVVAEIRLDSAVPVKYVAEFKRGIALTRNKVIANADGDYLALIDDDEFPAVDWLLKLFTACIQYKADGVLGPVMRHFDETPPTWLEKTRLFVRPVYPTGVRVGWRESRTSNVLLRRGVTLGDAVPFRPEFRAGEDQDFFYRKIEEGYTFIWSADAIVHEVIPPARWKRMYSVRRALLQGACELQLPVCGPASIAKSAIALPVYLLALPWTLLFGQNHFMTILEKLSYHAGKLLKSVGIDPIREEYVSD
jgi:succinoglycan biosynthesis protein ExoM